MTDAPSQSDFPFGTPAEHWAQLTPDQRAQFMQMELGEAQARHAAHRAETASADAVTWGAAQATIRLLVALNAGALVAILAFLGSMIEGKETLWLPPLIVSLVAFLFGALIATGTSALAFFAGSALVESLQGDVLTTTHPYVHGTPETIAPIDTYNRMRHLGIWLCIGSGTCAVVGSFSFLWFAIVALRPG